MLMSARTPFLNPTRLVLLPALVLPVKLTYSTSVVRGTNAMSRAGVRPALHRSQGIGLLCRCQFGDVIRNDAARPRLRLFRIGLHVRRVGLGGSRQRQQREHDETEAQQRKAKRHPHKAFKHATTRQGKNIASAGEGIRHALL